MTIEFAQDWFDNNISGEVGYTFDSENETYTKTISENDLNLEFSNDGEFRQIQNKWKKIVFIDLEFSDIILSHTVSVESTGFEIDDTVAIRLV